MRFTQLPSLKLTANVAPETWDGWKMIHFFLGAFRPIFRGVLVSFREGIDSPNYLDVPLEVIGSMVRINGLFHHL